MNYEQFLSHCQRFGLDPNCFLIPLALFIDIDNEAHYTTQDIAHLLAKSDRQIRRWFATGKVSALKKRPWTCTGIEFKNLLFAEHQKEIIIRMERFNA
ncbi:helix-turn-helix domain-containing protein [Paenibacillus sp. FSL K6-3166]|uniref:helix-turn-helix domain-containing protein n=1 Tax=unclassified Paenibacillus TaxID=185978 RepID=UPI000BA1089A|nr:helix-turn-helix domain-containing protein [Paenibacillus sp. VTT E-133291]MBY3618614.1 helix-turn-helix domain-containing protein [Acinetobacter sp. CUI P1]OZQ97263.1 hypothetical protein CA598_06820 [Paenibacillus sp. VTT E-133291]